MVWHSVRAGGDTKTRRSRRTLALPKRCVDALALHFTRQRAIRERIGDPWQDNDLVFCTRFGTELDAGNVRRAFKAITKKAGLDEAEWTPREMRHSFVSLLSDERVPLESICRLGGPFDTTVTETVYRRQLRPVMLEGAQAMDLILPSDGWSSGDRKGRPACCGAAFEMVGDTGIEPVTSSV
ncbi:tyrosine-type recombinase/integrase [Nonomuraea mangrovi]|uniref:Tyrosine-type recombinase/integrase n=1 Tax=Nonomuraea mangrovi TaxID=2316207 RepID=A0ABW4SS20_9ACTN